MAVQKIAFDIDGMLNSIDKIVARLQEFPSEGSLRVTHGANVGVTRDFRSELSRTGRQLESAANSIRDDLQRTQEAIRATLTTLVEQDASIADEADALLAAVESVVPVTPAPATAPSSAPVSSGSSATTVIR